MNIVFRRFPIDSLGRTILGVELQIDAAVVVEPDVELTLLDAAGQPLHRWRLRHHLDAIWLPRGRYAVAAAVDTALLAGVTNVHASIWRKQRGQACMQFERNVALAEVGVWRDPPAALAGPAPAIEALGDTAPVSGLSWSKGRDNWFHAHFDHAARTIIDGLLANSALLQGRVLDVGCGDGITDLGVALHCEPELMIGIDPFRAYENLPQILAEHGLPADAVPDRLRFMAADGNHLPFPDDSFDVVISWGAVEHIAGGYLQSLREMKRVLRDGGLLFIVPGLYYSTAGHHLGEFSDEPFLHLKHSEAELHALVHSTEPRRVDRAGTVPSQADSWRWFKELNPITVGQFERELRALEFEPWRVALRTQDLIEYTPELLPYPMQDLATSDLYLSCWNRKRPRPADFVMRTPGDYFAPR